MRVREVIPSDNNQSVVIPNENIRLSKTCYDDLHFQEKIESEREPSIK